MAIDISQLQEYITLHPNLLQTKVFEDILLKRIPVTEYPNQTSGKHMARIFDPVANLVECCTIPDGDSNVITKEIEAICLMDGQEYCETDLAQILRNADFRFTAGQESAGSLEQMIIDGQLAAFTEAIDILTFQGDTTSSDGNLNKIDGLIKKAQNATDSQKITIDSGDIYSAIVRIATSMNRNARRMRGGIGIFVSEEMADALQGAYMARNWYNYNPGTQTFGGDVPLIGFNGFTVIPTRGLNGTNTIIATPISNIAWLFSRRNDVNTLDWDYEKYHRKYYWRIETIFGVDFAIDEFVTIATLDPSVITNSYALNVNIAGPLGANGGVATDATGVAP